MFPKRIPNWNTIQPENAIKYTYDTTSGAWRQETVTVKIDEDPFARGALRVAFHIQEVGLNRNTAYVAKMSMDVRDQKNRQVYYRDVEMQALAKYYADQYNKYNPPKTVDFVKAWLLELVDREDSPLCGVERFIDGSYRKHNNNAGFVSEDERNTPQSFSHYTLEVCHLPIRLTLITS